MTDFELASRKIHQLSQGKHSPDSTACALEYLSVARGIPWTDSPGTVRCFDLRPINDIPVSDRLRTELLLPVLRIYDGSLDWPADRKKRVVERIIIATVQRLIAELPGLPADIAQECRGCQSLERSWEATRAAAWEAAGEAARLAAREAAGAAGAAATAATAAKPQAIKTIFRIACSIWLEAAEEGVNVDPS